MNDFYLWHFMNNIFLISKRVKIVCWCFCEQWTFMATELANKMRGRKGLRPLPAPQFPAKQTLLRRSGNNWQATSFWTMPIHPSSNHHHYLRSSSNKLVVFQNGSKTGTEHRRATSVVYQTTYLSFFLLCSLTTVLFIHPVDKRYK